MKNLKFNTIIYFKNIKELKGLYIQNQNGNFEEINHIVDRNNDGKTLRINGLYHKVSNLVFLKKYEDIFIEVRIKKTNEYSTELLKVGFKQ